MDGLLAHGECEVDGFICPGHVSTIIGSKPYEHIAKNYDKPCVIAGFEPHDVLLAILMILRQLASNQSRVEIEYKRSVRPNGNFFALGRMWKVFEPCDVIWRGVGLIPGSGFKLRDRFAKFDVKEKIGVQIKKSVEIRPGCKCGEIMKGVVKPRDCPFFKTKCTPEHPLGACIVSIEGPCNVAYRYGE
jgi:hydrogenase expression/formation protein HypD